MTVDLATDRAVAAAETLLDECVITRPPTGAPVWDPGLHTHNPEPATTVWTGACSVSTLTGRVLDNGGATAVAYTHVVRVPVTDGPTVQVGDAVTVTAVRDGGNTGLDGAVLVVVEVPEQSSVVLRRLGCTRRTVPMVPL